MTAETVSAISDVVVALAAAGAAVAAWAGLRTWRSELRGRHEYELARRLLLVTYRVRDRLASVRNPFLAAEEFPDGYDRSKPEWKSPEREASATRHVYSNRWDSLAAAMRDFETDALEAEVLWGSGAEQACKALRACVAKLRAAIEEHLYWIEYAHRGETREESERVRAAVWQGAAPSDPLSEEIAAAVGAVETLARPHLGGRR